MELSLSLTIWILEGSATKERAQLKTLSSLTLIIEMQCDFGIRKWMVEDEDEGDDAFSHVDADANADADVQCTTQYKLYSDETLENDLILIRNC